MNPDENDVLARRGQNQFKLWCENERLLCHPPFPDRLGWDFLVEFPEQTDEEIPLDQQNELKKAFAQVKSTTKRETSIRARLLALKNLVDADSAAFIFHIEFSKTEVRRARLLHIGKNRSSRFSRQREKLNRRK